VEFGWLGVQGFQKQRDFGIFLLHIANFRKIKNVVAGHARGDEMTGSATQINLILENRSIPLMFGFSATNRDEEIRKAILSFLGRG